MGETFATTALRIVEATGPVGAIIVSVLVGLVVGALVIFYFAGLVAGARTDKQQAIFQERLLKAFEALAVSEAALRKEVDVLQHENASLKDTIRELTASVDLLRTQWRRGIDLLRAVMDGKLAPSAINAAELGDVAG